MAQQSLLLNLHQVSKYRYCPKYKQVSLGDAVDYERLCSKMDYEKPPGVTRIALSHALQVMLGFRRVYHGRVISDFVVTGPDLVTSLIASLSLLNEGKSVIFYPYYIDDYDSFTRLYFEHRKNAVPSESHALIKGVLGITIPSNSSVERVVEILVEAIASHPNSEQFIFTREADFGEYVEGGSGVIWIMNPYERDPETFDFLSGLPQLRFAPKRIPSKILRLFGLKHRFISLVECDHVIFTGQKTQKAPRAPRSRTTKIGDAERKTQDLEILKYSDRNADIIESLNVCEKVKGQRNGNS